MTYGYIDKEKLRTFLKARQQRINTDKKSWEAALRENPRTAITERGSPLLQMAVILSWHRKKIGVDNCVLMDVATVIVVINRMKVQSWEEKRSRQ
jgi:hypothetical protein